MGQFDVAKKRTDAERLTVDFDGDEVKLTFNRAAVTGRFVRDIQTIKGEDGTADPLTQNAAYLAGTVLKWDLMDGDEPVPLTVEAILDLPYWIPERLVKEIAEAMFPNGKAPSGK